MNEQINNFNLKELTGRNNRLLLEWQAIGEAWNLSV